MLLLEKYNAGIMREFSILPEGKSAVLKPALLALLCLGNLFLEVPYADADVCSTPISHAKKVKLKTDNRWEGEAGVHDAAEMKFREQKCAADIRVPP